MHLSDFKKSGHTPTLLSAFLYFDVSFMVWVLLGPLAVFIAEDYHLTPAQKGLLVALPLLGGSVLRLVLGTLADLIGARKTALIGLALTLIPLLWGWKAAQSLSDLHIIGLLLGIAGASFAVALPLASRWYPPEHQGLAMGIAGAGNSGTVLTALFVPRIAKHFGDWHIVFGLAIIPIVLVWFIVALFAKDSPQKAAPRQWSEYTAVFREPDTLWFCLFYCVTFGGFVGLGSFLPTFFTDQYGLDKVGAGNLTALCVCAGSFVRPIGGYLADRLGGVRMLNVLYGVIAVLAIAIAQLPSLVLITTLLVMLMAVLGCGNGAVFQLAPQRFAQRIGVVTGIVGAAGGLGGFCVPFALGALKESRGSYSLGFLAFALCSAACVVLVMSLHPLWRRAGWLGHGGRAALATD
ncbi:MFS transporter, NNP family, nitrate/nitrite transporter [Abditibacterium utsteinense]|uniref:MFS transporter, NNP family, nitrate/nitrite transporter n=1 Tax=Abditibacterium utsteinense TaxID=1960156 RepID=A0A2S8SW33_9BACT|nr:nitrate/nitrite transporter [Abditibacterium utsteinense]PQV65003.1 MFS transporter, NNP family, nitrate/nitrite transporter [Abditibacterium utsteinense]